MRHLLLTGLFACATLVLAAQQTPQYSLYMLNRFELNPAYAGLDDALSLTGALRRQWVGLEGAPASQIGSAHLPVYLTGGGFGVQFSNETLGPLTSTLFTGAYNFQLPLGRSALLSLGVGGGILQQRLDGTALRTPEGTYPNEPGGIFSHEDPFLSELAQNGNTPVFNAGAYLKTESLEVGVSSTQNLEPRFAAGPTELQLVRTYSAHVFYQWDLTRTLALRPSAVVRSDARQTQLEFSALFEYNENIFGGASFRGYTQSSRDAVVIIAGLRLNEQTTLAYAYDLTLSSLQQVASGSHEIMIGYRLAQPIGKGRPPKIIYNPRQL